MSLEPEASAHPCDHRGVRPTQLALAIASLALSACPGRGHPPRDANTTDGALDAAGDASLRTITTHVEDPIARVSLTAGPLRLRVDHADGTSWFASPAATPFLEIGAYLGGPSPSRFHDPRVQSPSGIEWRSPTHVSDDTVDGATVLTLLDDRVGPVAVTIAAVSGSPGTFRLHVEARGADAAMLRFHLAADGNDAYHGLGERFGMVDARGAIVPMQLHVDGRSESSTNETHVPVPFMASTRSYGLFVATREAGAFDVASSDTTRVSATFEGAIADVYLFVARSPADVVAAYTRTAGLPRLPPRWAFGPMQWRNVWDSSDAMLADAHRLRAEDIPTTTMWIDNPWEASYNDHVFDTRRFPDPAALLGELRALGYRSIVWSTPYVDAVENGDSPATTAERLYETARDRNWLVRYPGGSPYISISNPASAAGMSARGGMIDFSSRDASAFWTERLLPLMDLGLRGFKLDYGEDIVSELGGSRTRFAFSDGSTERTQHSLYPQGYHAAYRAALDQRAGGDGFLIVRASSYGGERVADVIWPGDLDSDFSRHDDVHVGGLPAAINGFLSLAESGFPTFGSDTGGYRGGTPTREALLRWAEHTAFTPVMQLGGGGSSHNPWMYDADAVAIYRSLARVHTALVPYLRLGAVAASRDGTPSALSLAMAYADDLDARNDPYAYLLGTDLLVAPVVDPDVTTRAVHLPAGRWVHWFTGRAYDGAAGTQSISVPLGQPAVFLRQGAIVPMLADDVDTLVDATDTTVTDLRSRASILRARIVPAGHRTVELEDGTRLEVDDTGADLVLAFTPGTESRELRATMHLASAGAGPRAPTTVTLADGTPLTAVSDAITVDAGCDGCWYRDAISGDLHVAVRAIARVTAR